MSEDHQSWTLWCTLKKRCLFVCSCALYSPCSSILHSCSMQPFCSNIFFQNLRTVERDVDPHRRLFWRLSVFTISRTIGVGVRINSQSAHHWSQLAQRHGQFIWDGRRRDVVVTSWRSVRGLTTRYCWEDDQIHAGDTATNGDGGSPGRIAAVLLGCPPATDHMLPWTAPPVLTRDYMTAWVTNMAET